MKKPGFIIVFSVLLVFGLTALSFSQEGRGQGRIFGSVTDENGNPVAGAEIVCQSLQYQFSSKSTSNKKGNWAIAGIGSGMYRITVSKEGYLPSETQMSLSNFRNPPIDFVLKSIASANVQVLQSGEASKQIFTDALTFFNEGNYSTALELFKEFRKKNPTLYQIGINIGNCYKEMKEYDKAIEEYALVLTRLKTENPDLHGNEDAAKALTNIGETYLLKDEVEEGQRYLEQALEIFPSDHALAYNIAEIYFKRNQVDKAIEYYHTAIRINPDWMKAREKLGYAYLNKADYENALRTFKEYLDIDPEGEAADTIRNLIPQLERMIKN